MVNLLDGLVVGGEPTGSRDHGCCGRRGAYAVDLFHRNDWYVVGIDRTPPAHPTVADRFEVVDLAAGTNVETVFAVLDAEIGRVDALVNNAAIQIAKRLVDTTDEEWDTTMDTNVRMAFRAMRAAHVRLSERKGAVVNVSSVHAIATSRSIAVYAASKGALVALTRAAALEMAEEGIRVNAVLPGAVDTPMLRNSLGVRGDRTIEESMKSLPGQDATRHDRPGRRDCRSNSLPGRLGSLLVHHWAKPSDRRRRHCPPEHRVKAREPAAYSRRRRLVTTNPRADLDRPPDPKSAQSAYRYAEPALAGRPTFHTWSCRGCVTFTVASAA